MDKDRINRVVDLLQGEIDRKISVAKLHKGQTALEHTEVADALIAALDAYIVQNRQCWEGGK